MFIQYNELNALRTCAIKALIILRTSRIIPIEKRNDPVFFVKMLVLIVTHQLFAE